MAAKKYQVFISSTYKDLVEERWAAMRALLSVDCIISGMELFPAIDQEQFEYIRRMIDDCDYYLLLLGGRYGTVNEKTGLSYTEMEYDYAVGRGIKVIALVYDKPETLPPDRRETDSAMLGKFQAFRDKVTNERLVRFWTDQRDLLAQIPQSMFHVANHFPATGWVRANKVASEDMLAEINQLRKENDALKHDVASLRSQFELEPDDSFFDDEKPFVISAEFDGERREVIVEIKDIYCALLLPLREWLPESWISSTLFEQFCATAFPKFDPEHHYEGLDEASIAVVIYKLSSLGLIEESDREWGGQKARAMHYKLSPLGRKLALKYLVPDGPDN